MFGTGIFELKYIEILAWICSDFVHLKLKNKFHDIMKLPFYGSKNHCSPKLNDYLNAILLHNSHA